jgi:hypothetical protein
MLYSSSPCVKRPPKKFLLTMQDKIIAFRPKVHPCKV